MPTAALPAWRRARQPEFKPQELATTVRAYTTVGVAAPGLFAAVADVAERRVGDFNPQGVANTGWAHATAGELGNTNLYSFNALKDFL